jgi:citrate synthase
MADTLTITDNRTGKQYEVPIQDGAIRAADLRKIRVAADDFGLMTYDPAFMNTAACRSRITFIDGDQSILLYRGYPIEQLAEHSDFLETSYLLLFGELPTESQLEAWTRDINAHTMLHENVKKFIDGFNYDAHPMGMFLSAMGAMSTFYPDAKAVGDAGVRRAQMVRMIAKVPGIAAFAYRHIIGRPYNLPDSELSYTGNFLNMLFKMTELRYKPHPSSNGRSTCSSSCTPITNRTAARLRCVTSAARTWIPTRPWPAPRPPSTARFTAGPTRRWCGCSRRSGRSRTFPRSSSGSRQAKAG